MPMRPTILAILLASAASTSAVVAQAPDPRTAAGQLAACGGAANWGSLGYLEFAVKIKTSQRERGPWHYHWDRRHGFLRLAGTGTDGSQLDLALDLGSRTGGGWRNGEQLMGKELADAVNWALQRFGEDILWLTFPLEWGAPGVTVTPLADSVGADGRAWPAVRIASTIGPWDVLLDPTTGRVYQTIFVRGGLGKITATWQEWEEHGGVFFAHKRSIAETGETVELDVLQTASTAPPSAF